MADTLKTYSVLFNWADGTDQGTYGTVIRAVDYDDAEDKGRADMRENHIANHCKADATPEEIAESCAEYESEFLGKVVFGGEMLECAEGAIWKAADMEKALRPFAMAASVIPAELADEVLLFAHFPSLFGAPTELRVGDFRAAQKLIAEIDGIA